jgi:hypothetical protein
MNMYSYTLTKVYHSSCHLPQGLSKIFSVMGGPVRTGRIDPHDISRVFRVIVHCAERHDFGAYVVHNRMTRCADTGQTAIRSGTLS